MLLQKKIVMLALLFLIVAIQMGTPLKCYFCTSCEADKSTWIKRYCDSENISDKCRTVQFLQYKKQIQMNKGCSGGQACDDLSKNFRKKWPVDPNEYKLNCLDRSGDLCNVYGGSNVNQNFLTLLFSCITTMFMFSYIM